MPERMKPYFPSAMLMLLIVYLGVQALTGERGLLSGGERDAMLLHQAGQLGLAAQQHGVTFAAAQQSSLARQGLNAQIDDQQHEHG